MQGERYYGGSAELLEPALQILPAPSLPAKQIMEKNLTTKHAKNTKTEVDGKTSGGQTRSPTSEDTNLLDSFGKHSFRVFRVFRGDLRLNRYG